MAELRRAIHHWFWNPTLQTTDEVTEGFLVVPLLLMHLQLLLIVMAVFCLNANLLLVVHAQLGDDKIDLGKELGAGRKFIRSRAHFAVSQFSLFPMHLQRVGQLWALHADAL